MQPCSPGDDSECARAHAEPRQASARSPPAVRDGGRQVQKFATHCSQPALCNPRAGCAATSRDAGAARARARPSPAAARHRARRPAAAAPVRPWKSGGINRQPSNGTDSRESGFAFLRCAPHVPYVVQQPARVLQPGFLGQRRVKGCPDSNLSPAIALGSPVTTRCASCGNASAVGRSPRPCVQRDCSMGKRACTGLMHGRFCSVDST